MVLESIVICIDNSEYMRNEDFLPNRMKAQIDAVQVLIYAKLRSSPENYLSLVTLANNRVLTHLTNQEAKLSANLSQVEMEGSVRLAQSLNVSQLVLKHRPIKHAKCKVIAFVGSPVLANESDIINLGKRFKKENVTVDIVSFGGEPGVEVLKTLVETLNGPNGTSNSFHSVPTYLILSDYVVSAGLVAANREFGMSDDYVDEDEELRRAIEWSMQESGGQSSIPQHTAQPTGIQDGNDLSDDEQLRIALQLSLQEAERLEAIREGSQQPNDTRTATPNTLQQNGTNDSVKPDSASSNTTPNLTSDPTTPPADTTDTLNAPKRGTEKSSPSNPNPNNNSNNAAAAPSNIDTGKTVADNKETKKTILTKKDKRQEN